MLKALTIILEIQEMDMKMIQLMRLKRERQKDLENINNVKEDFRRQAELKEGEIAEMKLLSRSMEGELAETKEKIKKLDAQQSSIKKVEEFNALSHEMSQADREKILKEQRLSDHYDRLAAEEDNPEVLSD